MIQGSKVPAKEDIILTLSELSDAVMINMSCYMLARIAYGILYTGTSLFQTSVGGSPTRSPVRYQHKLQENI